MFSSFDTCASVFCGYYILVAAPVTTTAVFIATFHKKEATTLHVLCDCEVIDESRLCQMETTIWNQTAVIRSAFANSVGMLKRSVVGRIQNRTKMNEMQVITTYVDIHYNLKYCRSGWMWVPYLYMVLLFYMLKN